MSLRAAGSVPGTGGRAVLRARIDAQLRSRAVTGVGRRGAICFVCGRRRRRGFGCHQDDGPTDGLSLLPDENTPD